MILLVKRNNIALIVLTFLLSVAIYALNSSGVQSALPASSTSQSYKVIIDAGHGGEDPGAVSDYSGACEKEINLKIALKLKELMENEGYLVVMTRDSDTLVYDNGTTNIVQKRKQDLLRRKNIMDTSGADIVVSIHMNKFPQTQYYGAQAFFPPNSQESMKLATALQNSIKELADPDNKRVALLKKEQIIILKDLKTPTCIVECGFLSNADEEKKLLDEEYQLKLAEAIKKGMDNYFEDKN